MNLNQNDLTLGLEILTYSSFFASFLAISIIVHLRHDRLPLQNESSHGRMTANLVCLDIFK